MTKFSPPPLHKLLLLGTSIGVSLVILVAADVMLGHYHYSQTRPDSWIRGVHIHDSALGWTTARSTTGHHRNGDDFNVSYELDAEGFKTVANRGTPRRRIFLFGDSYTFGHGVTNHDTFANVMARSYLAEDVHVFNAGVMGYGIQQMLGRLIQVEQKLRPGDIVLFTPTPQDIKRTFDEFSFPAKLYHRRSLENVTVYPVYRDGKLTTVSLEDPWLEFKSYFFVGRVTKKLFTFLHAAVVNADAEANARAMIADARHRAEIHGARFELLFLPESHESRSGKSAVDISAFDHYDVQEFFPMGEESAEIRFAGDSHWNPAGHAIAARAIASTLARAGILKPNDLKSGLALDSGGRLPIPDHSIAPQN